MLVKRKSMAIVLRLFAEVLNRPRVSAKVKDYVMQHFAENVLFPKKLLKEDKFDYYITLQLYHSESERIQPEKKFSASKNLKYATIFIYHPKLNSKTTPTELAEIIYDALGEFFMRLYKKIKREDIEEAKQKLD